MREALAGDYLSQPLVNYYPNPSAEIAAGTVAWRTNLAPNPSSESAPAFSVAGTGSATATMTTAQAFTGTGSVQVVAPTQTNSAGFKTEVYTVTPNTVYTVSFYVYLESGVFPTMYVTGSDYSTGIVTMNGYPATGAWAQFSATLTTTSTQTTLMAWGISASAGTYYLDAILLEAGTTLGGYFDGDTGPDGDYAHSWTGTPNASTSIETLPVPANWISNYEAGYADAGFGQVTNNDGTKAVVLRKGSGYTYTNPGRISGLKRNHLYTVQVDAYSPTATRLGLVDRSTGYSRTLYPITTSWTTIRRQITSDSNGSALADFGWEHTDVPTGSVVYMDNFMLTEGIYTGQYYDGSSFGWQWSGSADASISVGYPIGPAVITNLALYGNTNGPPWYAACNAPTSLTGNAGGPCGSFVRLTATAAGSGTCSTYFSPINGRITTGTAGTAVYPGLTYTVAAFVRVTMANFTIQPRLRVRWKTAAGSTISDAPISVATAATNGNWTRLSVTATAAAGAAYMEVLGGYDGASGLTAEMISSGDTVDVTGVTITLGSTAADYLDGSFPSARWNGAANASTSTGYPLSLRGLADAPLLSLTSVAPSGSVKYQYPAQTNGITVYSVQYDTAASPSNDGYWQVNCGSTRAGRLMTLGISTNQMQAALTDQAGNFISSVTSGLTDTVAIRNVYAVRLPNNAGSSSTININGGSNASSVMYGNPFTYTDSLYVGSRDNLVASIVTDAIILYSGIHTDAQVTAISKYLRNAYGA